MVAPKVVNTGTPFTRMTPSCQMSRKTASAPTRNSTAQMVFKNLSWVGCCSRRERSQSLILTQALVLSAMGYLVNRLAMTAPRP